MSKELSNTSRAVIVGLSIASFFLTIVVFYSLLPRTGVDPNTFLVISLVAAGFISYLFLVIFRIVKEVSLKGGSFEFTSKLEEVKEKVEDTKKEVASGLSSVSNAIQSINTRIDTVITSQLSNRLDQKNEFTFNMKEIQEKKMEAQEKAKKIIADASGVSPSLPVPGPKAIESEAKKNDSNTYFDYAMDILKGLATLSTGGTLDVQSELNKAYALIVEGKYKEALKIYDAILSTDPYNTEAWLRKGICLFYLGRKNNSPEYHKQSITIYDKVLQLEPTNKKALHMKGVASYYLGKIPLANEYYDKVLSIDPNFGPSLYNKACNLSRLGKKDESLEYLQKAILSDQKYKHWASKDDAFKDLETDPKFKKMTKFDF